MPHSPAYRTALVLMVLVSLLWSSGGVLARLLEHPQGAEVAFWRSLFAALFCGAALAVLHGARVLAVVSGIGRAGLVSGALWGVMFTAFMVGVTLTTVANVFVMASIAPLLTALLAWRVLGDRVPARTWAAIGATVLGMGIMFGGGFGVHGARDLAGMLVALAIPVGSALNIVNLRRAGGRIDLVPTVFVGACLSALATLPFAVPLESGAPDLAVLGVMGVFQLGVPCMLLVVVARTLPAAQVALLALLEVLLAPVWAWLFVGEVPAGATLAGGLIVFTALFANQAVALRRAG